MGTFSAAQLAAGVDLASAPGPWLTLGEDVLRRCAVQSREWCPAGRDFFASRVQSWMPAEAKPELDAMLASADRGLAKWDIARKQAPLAGLETTWTLTRVAAPGWS